MTPLVSQLWPQFMADPDFAASFGRVIVEHARMLRQERQVVFTLRSAAPLDKGLCARLLASLQPDYEGFELKIDNLFGYATLDEAALRELMEEMKRDASPSTAFWTGAGSPSPARTSRWGSATAPSFCRRWSLSACWRTALPPTPVSGPKSP